MHLLNISPLIHVYEQAGFQDPEITNSLVSMCEK